jgi:hypothetical protein
MEVIGASHAPEEIPSLQAEWLVLGFCPGLSPAFLGVGPPAGLPADFFFFCFPLISFFLF